MASPRSRASSPRQAASHKSYAPVQRLLGHSGHVWDLACSSDLLFSAGGDSTIRCAAVLVPCRLWHVCIVTEPSECGTPFSMIETAVLTAQQIWNALLCSKGTSRTFTVSCVETLGTAL